MGIRRKILKKLCLLLESEYSADVKAQAYQPDPDYDNLTFKTKSILGFENGDQLFTYFPEQYGINSLPEKNILDLGCGYGGPAVFYALNGASRAFGLDITFRNVRESRKFSVYKKVNNTFFVQGDAKTIPFGKESFDIITTFDFFEHVDRPEDALKESYRVLNKGGIMILGFPPFFHPWGAHLSSVTRFPWLHVFFSPREIIDVCNEIILERPGDNERFLFPLPIRDNGKERFASLNRMTISKFRKLIESSGFFIQYYKLVPMLSLSSILSKNKIIKKFRFVFVFLPLIPLIREFTTSKVVCVLEKTR